MKHNIFGRVAQLAKANINALLDQAEDPQKMLDQMLRDYSANITEAESAISQSIGNLRMLEEDHSRSVSLAYEWGRKALAASRKADGYRAVGNTSDAQKFDNLAKVAIQRQMSAEKLAKDTEPGLTSQNQIVDRLMNGLDSMKSKLTELTGKRNELLARSRTAAAQTQISDAPKGLDAGDPTSAIGRYEEKIRCQEATVRGQQELASSSVVAQFASLEDLGEQTAAEARPAALKGATASQKSIETGIGGWFPARI